MTAIVAIKTKLYNEYEGFIEYNLKSSCNMIQNRFYLHGDTKITENSDCIIILQIKNNKYAKYLEMTFKQIENTTVKTIFFD